MNCSKPLALFVYLFDKEILKENPGFIKNLVDDDHWEPNWNWSGMYPDEWSAAKEEWSGNLTVKNLLILQNFKGA
jgi:hypothetical protein